MPFILDELQEVIETKEFYLFKESLGYAIIDSIPSKKYLEYTELGETQTPTIDSKIVKCSNMLDAYIQKSIKIFFKIKLSSNKLDLYRIQIKELDDKKQTAFTIYDRNEYRKLQLKYGEELYVKNKLHTTLYTHLSYIKHWYEITLELLSQKGMDFNSFFNYYEKNKEIIENECLEELSKIMVIQKELQLTDKEVKKLPYLIEYLNKIKKTRGGKKNETL